MMWLWLFLASLPLTQEPREPPTITVVSPRDGTENIFLGFIAFGAEGDIQALEAAARAANVFSGRPETEDGRIELMVIFDSRTPREQAFDLYNRARNGDFGTLQVEMMIIPPDAIRRRQ